MLGMAAIAGRNDGGFDYREHGKLALTSGQTLDAERHYVFIEERSGFVVFFVERPPRLFHRVSLNRAGQNLIGEAPHLCGADYYDSRYEFRDDGSFTIRHAVVGPRKRYTMSTEYHRLSPERTVSI